MNEKDKFMNKWDAFTLNHYLKFECMGLRELIVSLHVIRLEDAIKGYLGLHPITNFIIHELCYNSP